MRLKDDTVVWDKFVPEMHRIFSLVDLAYRRIGLVDEAVMTSGYDGIHSIGSLHWIGRAADFRTQGFSHDVREEIKKTLAKWLGGDYDVVLEPDHLHIEYDPK